MQSTGGACTAGAAERTVGAILGLDWLPSDGPTSGPGKITAGPPLGPSTTFDGEGGSPFAGRPGLLDFLGCGETDGVAALTSLVSHLISPTAAPRLCSPPPARASPPPNHPPQLPTMETPAPPASHSGRLASKPTAGMAMMDKVKLVLMKKNGLVTEAEVTTEDGLKKYADMYKKPLSPLFMGAVTALLDASSLGPKKGSESLIVA